ncbi:MAG: DUF1206 domain-containing protein, partial [Ilumatobacteraceae bacterium]
MSHNPLAREAAAHPNFVRFGRFGWFAKGVIYVLAGVLALTVVGRSFGWSGANANGDEASPTGAIKEVAQSSGGPLLLIVLAGGMFLYAAWRLVTVFFPGRTDVGEMLKRIGYFASAIMYVTFGITAISLAWTRNATANGNKTVGDFTTDVMTSEIGRWSIGVVGAIIIATGLYRIFKGLKVDVTDDINMAGMSAGRTRWTKRIGSVGEIGRGISVGLIGFFLLRAAISFDAHEATGLDGALRRLAIEPWGVYVVAG